MAHTRGKSFAAAASSLSALVQEADYDIQWPFGDIEGLTSEDIRETAYEIFFTSCRSSPGFGGKTSLSFNSRDSGGGGGGSLSNGNDYGEGSLAVTSKVKKGLGLKTLRRSVSNMKAITPGPFPGSLNTNADSGWLSPLSPGIGYTVPPPNARARKRLTCAEIMRQQMKVMEESDVRLRKTLMRSLIGQMGRRGETIILPLELLRHLKPSEFSSPKEYHLWQKRQLSVLENGLLLHPSIPLEPSNSAASSLREIIRSVDSDPLDTSKDSESMQILSKAAVSLAMRNVGTTETLHWADGYPLNVNIYTALLRSIFNMKDETDMLDEVDELLELMKKTWSTLGITREIHNLCFAFVLFHQYVVTSQLEPDLLGAALTVLSTEVEKDVKREKNEVYTRILASVIGTMLEWTEKRLLDYHEYFQKCNVHILETLLPLALSARHILHGNVFVSDSEGVDGSGESVKNTYMDRVDVYVRGSLKNAFAKMIETMNLTSSMEESEASEIIIQLATETEELASREIEHFSPILKKWHPISGGIAAVTLHGCYGTVLRQYLSGISNLRGEIIQVLERAGKLESVLVQIVVEDSENCEDGGKGVVREMVPYEINTIILDMIRKWIDEKLHNVKDCIDRAKETETWNPKSKNEPYAYSGVELMSLAKELINEFFSIPICIPSDLVNEFLDGLDHQIQDYITFIASCGSKQGYIPTLPPLIRNPKVSKIRKLLPGPCTVVCEGHHFIHAPVEINHHLRPSTSRGTQRLYIRLNTLHYLESQLNSLDKTLFLSHSHSAFPSIRLRLNSSSSFFELSHSSVKSATHTVSEVAAYRLIFLDTNFIFYDTLYNGGVATARIKPTLRILKQNVSLLSAILIDKVQPLALKEVIKASFDAFLMVLLAGGNSRVFQQTDQEMIDEDFAELKQLFCTCGNGLISENVVQHEAESVEDILLLMTRTTEELVEDFGVLASDGTDIGLVFSGKKMHTPASSGMWDRSDPNTILRILYGRNDRVGNQFLKKVLHLGKR